MGCLGIPRNRLYKWREQLRAKDADTAFPGQGRRRDADAELAALKTPFRIKLLEAFRVRYRLEWQAPASAFLR